MNAKVVAVALALALTPLVGGSSARAADDAAATSADSKAEEIADRVQAFYQQTRTFKASFKQKYWIKAHNKTKSSRGDVRFEKPGKMSWRYSNGNRVVSDGKVIKVYEKENRQMYEQPLDKSQYPAALAFLVGEGDLKKSFRLRLLDSKQMKFEGGYVLEGVPVEATPAYQSLILYVDAKTAHVRRVMLLDAQGNRNVFTFDKPVVNKRSPKGEFEYTPPPGTEVVRP